MTEPPQFRTVIRGVDPQQVHEAIEALDTSLVTARRAMADMTKEQGRLQHEHAVTQAALRDAERRIAELEEGHASYRSYDEVGSRINSILSLADEESSRLRVEAEVEAAQRLEQSNHDAITVRQEAHDEAERVRAAAAAAAEKIVEQAHQEAEGRRRELHAERDAAMQARDLASSEGDRLRVAAHQEAEQTLQGARDEAAAVRSDAVSQLAEAVGHRDRVKAHLTELSGVIASLAGSIPGSTPDPSAPIHDDTGR